LSVETSFKPGIDSVTFDLGSVTCFGFKNEQVLIYMLENFKRIAAGPDKLERRWLKKVPCKV
jgi:hypothetical protein